MKSAQRADEVAVDRAYRDCPLPTAPATRLAGPTRTPAGRRRPLHQRPLGPGAGAPYPLIWAANWSPTRPCCAPERLDLPPPPGGSHRAWVPVSTRQSTLVRHRPDGWCSSCCRCISGQLSCSGNVRAKAGRTRPAGSRCRGASHDLPRIPLQGRAARRAAGRRSGPPAPSGAAGSHDTPRACGSCRSGEAVGPAAIPPGARVGHRATVRWSAPGPQVLRGYQAPGAPGWPDVPVDDGARAGPRPRGERPPPER